MRDPRLLSQYRKALEKGKELFTETKISSIQPVPPSEIPRVLQRLKYMHEDKQQIIREEERREWKEPRIESLKCLLLRPGLDSTNTVAYGSVLKEGLEAGDIVSIFPYDLQLEYDYWTWNEIVTSILPENLHSEIPHGFNSVGHVAHLNLREHHLPYRRLIGEILLSKGQPSIRTVINKTDEVGEASEFRTFTYELLAGEDNLDVEVKKMGCIFRFNYGKVYWNSKLDQEHRRLVDMFSEGQVVVDVMAGIGPFAIPAAKKGVIVWANDYNPESVKYMSDAIKYNKVEPFVFTFNQDGHKFIPFSTQSVMRAHQEQANIRIPKRKPLEGSSKITVSDVFIPIPPVISHFVMNLPASAPEFLPAFHGIYYGKEENIYKEMKYQLPFVHVYCFATKQDHARNHLHDPDLPYREITMRISEQLGFRMKITSIDGNLDSLKEGDMTVWDVREVAPTKSMYCASFRLPRAVAFSLPHVA